MRVWVRGRVYDAENEMIVLFLSKRDKKNIASMDEDASRYAAAPEDVSEQEMNDAVTMPEPSAALPYESTVPHTGTKLRDTPSRIDQLLQLVHGPVWDGNLVSKHDVEELRKAGLCTHAYGWTFLTPDGVRTLSVLGYIHN